MVRIAAFYRFVPIADPGGLRDRVRALCRDHAMRGTVLVAPEGINGTVAGSAGAVEATVEALGGWLDAPVAPRLSDSDAMPFGRLKVRVKREIVTMGAPGLDVSDGGERIAPADWNAVLRDPDSVVVDVRNAFEVAIGSFAGAEDPGTASFGAFPDWWRANAERLAGKRVAMFCTGGIRCEKAGAWLRDQGVARVAQLEGGILGYLDAVPRSDSLWRGGCFVFDERVALGHGLAPTGHAMCHACRRPLPPEGRDDPAWEDGVSCAACIGEYSDADRARFRERMRQMDRAAARGALHLGRTA
ncbi:rhodanese-related sulfurtransferase [Jannaschia sp. LMIT008]|uniref:oxygen-dependent tRNA uridine(34) hydroxylase TrhO n=1 Tax=Jannaschia maritima TaxID=3032585 RepID=UPI002811E6C9|nr:rhodanese-related sulfurtransferase [Jannaschia sp. LMIT008]